MVSPAARTLCPLSLETSQSSTPVARPCSHLPSSSSSSSSSSSALASTPTWPLPSSSSLSLYVTYRILSVVNALRKRVTERVHARPTKRVARARARRAFCQSIEVQACEEIDRYLGRRTVYPSRKGARNGGKTQPLPTPTNSEWTDDNSAAEAETNQHIQRLLRKLGEAVNVNDYALDSVAKDNKLFLDRRTEFHIEKLSLKGLIELSVTVKDLLESLKQSTTYRGGVLTLAEGHELLDATLDEIYVANLEHLLLCLQHQLVRLLIAKCVELVQRHVSDCQKDQSRRCEEWFFEFPDARHPESTTWPWSLKPSLAVLWGVCWMFYNLNDPNSPTRFDAEGNIVDLQGRVLVPSQAVNLYIVGRQSEQQRRASYSPEGGQNLNIGPSQPIMAAQLGPRIFPPETPDAQPHLLTTQAPTNSRIATSPYHHHFRHASRESPSSRSLLPDVPRTNNGEGAHDQAVHAVHSLAQATSNTYSAAPPPAWTPATFEQGWLPQENLTFDGLGTDHDNAYTAAASLWPLSSVAQSQPKFDVRAEPDSHLPLRARNVLTPQIRLITSDISPYGAQQPQDNTYYSASSASSQPLHEETFTHTYPAHLSLQTPRHMAQVQAPEAAMSGTHPHPVSPVSPHSPHHDPALMEQSSRKRSHSEMSRPEMLYEHPPPPYPPPPPHHQQQQPLEGPRSRAGSVGSGAPNSASPGVGDDYSPRGSRSFKRGDPPVNTDNKYFCNFSAECNGQTFDRKCEWSKHMDKHDRPYRCPHTQCGKLQGFTYSGGLLRHEREVHGKHGGPKAQLMCPHDDCKRHAGKGFTRKENLNEHIRRVHDGKSVPSQQDSDTAAFKAVLQDSIAGAEHVSVAEIPMPTRLPYPEPAPQCIPEPAKMVKRRRVEDDGVGLEDVKQREIDRLLAENAEQAARMREMETREAQRELRMNQLEEMLRTVHGGPQPSQDDADRQQLPSAEQT